MPQQGYPRCLPDLKNSAEWRRSRTPGRSVDLVLAAAGGIRYTFWFNLFSFMSQHRSLKGASTISAKRNVLKRFERVELLKKRGQFKDGDKVIGLRKTLPEA
jgi:small basic protein (TIGR04137 family)